MYSQKCRLTILFFCLVIVHLGFGSINSAEAKSNTVILSGSDWLGGNGVSVYSNDGSYDSTEGDFNYVSGVNSGYRWQCVELINRLYLSRGWISATWVGNAKDMFGTAPSDLSKEPNGSIASVRPGDVVVFSGGWGGYGHVMIVDSVNGSTINIVSQNISNPRGTLVWNQAQKTITPWSGYSVVGIVHAPGNVSNGGSDGYFHGTPPDGAVIENHEDGGHKYVAIGGALALIPPETIWGYVEQMHARIPSGQFHEIVWMHSNDIHNIEYGFGGDRSHVPADNSFFYENGSTQQYVIQYRYAFSVGTAEELSSLGGTNRAIMVPPGLHARLAGVPEIPNDAILKAISNPTYYHIVNGTAYWANNFTVIDCIQTVKNGRLQPVPWSLILTLDNNGRINGQPTHCSFPPNWAIYGPGGAERWRVDGANPYVRHRYADPLALHCRLGSFLTQVQLPDVAGINESTEAEPLNCPNNTFVRIAGNGEVYQVVDNVLHYVMSPSALACLTSGHPEVVIDVDGRDVVTAPRGSDAYCSFEGKMVQAPSGRVYFVKGGTRYYVPSWGVLSCLKGRSATGDPIIVDQSTFEGYGDSGATAYCPYEIVPRLNFVQENGDSTVWVVGPPSAPGQPGVKRHAGSLCVPDPYTTGLLQYRISIVPPGETAGHVQGLDFWASGASCQALRQG